MVYFFTGHDDFFPRQASRLPYCNKGFSKVAKTKTTKRTTKTKQTSVGDMEVTVCRRRGERRQATPSGSTTTKAPAASAASAAKTAVTKGSKKPAKPAKGAAVSPVEVQAASKPVIERRKKVPRRRQIDPTTCERDYTGDEIEFMHALDAYKRSSGRMFPTCSEILEVVRGLGYVRVCTGEEYATGGLAKDDADPVGRSESAMGLTL
jgi:hypothetical protein